MNHVTIMEYHGYTTLKDKVDNWLSSNETDDIEIVGIEYEQHGEIYLARITYIER